MIREPIFPHRLLDTAEQTALASRDSKTHYTDNSQSYLILDRRDQYGGLYTVHRNESEFTNYTIKRSDVNEKCCVIERGSEKKNTNKKTFNDYHSSETNDRTLAHFIPFSP